MLAKALQGGTSAAQTYVDDVFSTYLYTGNGSTQTITNGIDLAGKGGMVWIKARTPAYSHELYDTARGATKFLVSNSTQAGGTDATRLTAFNANGFSYGSGVGGNGNGDLQVSWTFRKAPKFFDVVTYTGNGTTNTINHNLGSIPGCIIVKRTDNVESWWVYHRSLTSTNFYLTLNGTGAQTNVGAAWITNVTATSFQLTSAGLGNGNGDSCVAYLFAHDTAADGLIQCGSYTGNGSATGPTVTLGWEPQWLLIKNASGTGNWVMLDVMRGLVVGAGDAILQAESTAAEAVVTADGRIDPTATGFNVVTTSTAFNTNGSDYIYIAIRRPNKPPTSGTQVFQPTVYTGTNVDNRLVDTTIAPDMVWVRQRDDTVLGGMVVGDRLRGQPYLLTGTTAAEVNDADSFDQQIVSTTEYGTAFSAMNGFWCGNDATAKLNANTTSNNHIVEAFKRAPGFFDVVCWTGTGVNPNVLTHNLGVAPALIINKSRGASSDWDVSIFDAAFSGGVAGGYLNATNAFIAGTGNSFFNSPTSTTVSVTSTAGMNTGSRTNVAYLFASLPGISKVGSYTGNGGTVNTNGTSQTINCGFAAGARFVLIKRTDSTGDWYVFDSARGIVAGNDPYLRTNSTAAEVTTVDAVDADNSGFIVNQTSGTNLNVTNATYIYLAIS